MTLGDILKAEAESANLPRCTIEKAKTALAIAKKSKSDTRLARMMLQFGRLTDEARAYVQQHYPK